MFPEPPGLSFSTLVVVPPTTSYASFFFYNFCGSLVVHMILDPFGPSFSAIVIPAAFYSFCYDLAGSFFALPPEPSGLCFSTPVYVDPDIYSLCFASAFPDGPPGLSFSEAVNVPSSF